MALDLLNTSALGHVKAGEWFVINFLPIITILLSG